MTSRPTNPIAEILERAADLIEPEGAWTQHAMALDYEQAPLMDGYDWRAVCWCGQGAVEYVLGEDLLRHREVDALLDRIVGMPFDQWNDAPGRTQSEVVSKLREAASLARKGVGE